MSHSSSKSRKTASPAAARTAANRRAGKASGRATVAKAAGARGAARAKASAKPAPPVVSDDAPIEIVVRRGALRRYDQLKQKSGDLPVKLIWDRRVENRRRDGQPVEGERRRTERRQAAQFTWDVADFVVVGSAARAERSQAALKRRKSG